MSWSGLYRVEGLKIENSELNSTRRDKAYLLHHLILQPKMVAADGVTIYGRFDLMNAAAYPDSQLGQVFGNGPGEVAPGNLNNRTSNVLAQHGSDESLAVTQLYAHWVHEFGSLVVGRAPVQFGLGMTHNAGQGMFDHWFDTRDMVGYKIVSGNLFFFPMMGKVNEGNLGIEDDVNDYMIHVQYENPETDLALGVMLEWRVATNAGTDTPTGASGIGGAGSVVTNSYKHQLRNLYVSQRNGSFKFGLEGGMQTGKTGVRQSVGAPEIDMNGYGIAAEVNYKKPESKWDWTLKAGVASGDDPGTNNKFEGFIFDRNYDVAMLMFNHPLGQADFLRTSLNRDTTQSPSSRVDEEAVSNVFYLSPRFQNQWKERTSWGASFTYATLDTAPIVGANVGSDLGFEVDFNLTYKPYDRLTWVTEAALLFPGDAWKGGTQNFDNKFAYGVSTKAAISF
ncbi:MAG: alginate export family protein [Bdellovibrionaceae bacterium]|nr:alginate export family protein [Pseudobdellovibrionaceae bacterium]